MKQEKKVGRLIVLGTRKGNPGSTERQSYHQGTQGVKRANIFVAKPELRERGPERVPRGGKVDQVAGRNSISLIGQ